MPSSYPSPRLHQGRPEARSQLDPEVGARLVLSTLGGIGHLVILVPDARLVRSTGKCFRSNGGESGFDIILGPSFLCQPAQKNHFSSETELPMSTDALIFDAIRTPRGKGKSSGSLYSTKPVDLVVGPMYGP